MFWTKFRLQRQLDTIKQMLQELLRENEILRQQLADALKALKERNDAADEKRKQG